MNYPMISEYVDAILSAEDNFDKLVNLRPVLDDKERPVMSVGNFAVVFKMEDKTNGRLYAVKCFIKDQEGRAERYAKITEELQNVSSPYLINVQYLERELSVKTENRAEKFPVLVMDWIDGKTLDEYILAHIHNKYAMQMLFYRFCKMGAWLLTQSFAHGDLKPGNIIVREDGTMVLVDYDGMYVQTMKGEEATEIGGTDFRHPLRTDKNFNEHIDDFAIASIALSLKTIALDPVLYNTYSAADRLLFSASDYSDIGQSAAMKAIMPLASDPEMCTVISLFLLAVAKTNLSSVSFRLLLFNEPEKPLEMEVCTKITEEEKKNAVSDEYGALYTADGLKLIKGPDDETSYTIKQGTVIIGDDAFWRCTSLQSINIPGSVTSIGYSAFLGCKSLKSINIPDSVTSIGKRVFNMCESLIKVDIFNKNYYTQDNMLISSQGVVLSCWSKADNIVLPDSVTSIGDRAFSGCESLQSINIPDSVTSIGDGAFNRCGSQLKVDICNKKYYTQDHILISSQGIVLSCWSKAENIVLPDSVTSIGNSAFAYCESLQSINIPSSVTSIGDGAFGGCTSLQYIDLSDGLTSIGDEAFSGCESLQSINIPGSVTSIGGGAFNRCESLIKIDICNKNYYTQDNMLISSQGIVVSCWSKAYNIVLPDRVTSIGDEAFKWCKSLQSINIPDSVTSIGDEAFKWCESLQSINIPDSVTSIGKMAFVLCKSLQSINIPGSVTSIGDGAFALCKSLQSINIPGSVTSIGYGAFEGCKSLQSINIPGSVTYIRDRAFDCCESLKYIIIPLGTKQKFINMLGKEYATRLIER